MTKKKSTKRAPQFNIFEGARRVVILAQCIAVIIVSVIAYNEATDEIILQYDIIFAHGKPVISESKGCYYPDARKELKRENKNGKKFDINLCFRALESNDGRKVIPFKSDNNSWWGNVEAYPEVQSYMKDTMWDFVSDKTIEDDMSSQWWKQWREQRWEALKKAVANSFYWCVGIWLSAAVLGWIIRGFLRIPNGKDARDV